jgi:hypothetical protein
LGLSQTFAENLEYGQAAESSIGKWMRGKGWCVIPVYECLRDTGKGPQLFGPDFSLIAPDMLIFRGSDAIWIEAKHKTAFTMHRVTGRWVTGIDMKHYEDYCRVDDLSPWPVWLLFLHRGGQAKDSPANSPSGLFGNNLSILRKTENHRHDNHGRFGMVYWAISSLKLIASLEQVIL